MRMFTNEEFCCVFFFFSYSERLITHVQFQFINFRQGTHAHCPSKALADNAHDLATIRGFGWGSASVSASSLSQEIALRMFIAHSSASQNLVRMLQRWTWGASLGPRRRRTEPKQPVMAAAAAVAAAGPGPWGDDGGGTAFTQCRTSKTGKLRTWQECLT